MGEPKTLVKLIRKVLHLQGKHGKVLILFKHRNRKFKITGGTFHSQKVF